MEWSFLSFNRSVFVSISTVLIPYFLYQILVLVMWTKAEPRTRQAGGNLIYALTFFIQAGIPFFLYIYLIWYHTFFLLNMIKVRPLVYNFVIPS